MEPGQHELIFRVEERYWWHVGLRELVVKCLAAAIPPGANTTVLDAGCGTGMLLQDLSRRGYAHIVGVDVAPEAIVLARRRFSTIVRASVERLPFRDATFDAVTSLDMLQHLRVRDDVDALREMRRVLKPAGLLIVNVAAYERLRSPHDLVAHTRHRYRAGELRTKLVDAGFRVTLITYRNTFLFPLALVRRTLARVVAPNRPRTDLRPLPPIVNAMFTGLLRLENRLLALRGALPFGLSVFCVARRAE